MRSTDDEVRPKKQRTRRGNNRYIAYIDDPTRAPGYESTPGEGKNVSRFFDAREK